MPQPAAAPLLAIPPALRHWWRGQPRLALEDSPAAQLIELTAIAPVERLMVLGPDSPPLAALIADTAGLEPTPLAVLTGARPAPDAEDVQTVRAEPHHLPLPDGTVDFAVIPHQLRHWDDEQALRVLEEIWRILDHNGVAVFWEVARSRSAAVNTAWSILLGRNGSRPQLRTFGQLGQLAYDAGFAWVQTLPLRPFLFPPGPRLTVLVRKEHYTPENIGHG
ncbi:MAG: class I SAM-dependent methyltransferase [Chloroflexi bacterium]|nr:class I SAM-dependent methyltransferase [Chloroflexota bacterium]